ncbi:hypothetical protein BH23GEM6_BH23GEM6_26110 [soil metagenome]
MFRRITRHSALALGLALTVTACENSAGPGGETTILMSRSASTSLSSEALFSFTGDASLASVPLSSVASIEVVISRVDALPANLDENSEAAWVSLDVSGGGSLDLMKLSEAGVVLARGDLDAGDYRSVRLMVSSATITFNQSVTVGGSPNARTYAADVAHTLTIPSAAQTGIKVPTAGFSVSETTGDEVTVVFDASASVQSIQALPTGVQMSPVLTARSN